MTMTDSIAVKTVNFTGTVSEGTMRPQDVLPAIMGVLAEYRPSAFNMIQYELAFGDDTRFTQCQASIVYSEMCRNDNHPYWDSEDVSWIINELAWDAMNDIAPEGYYFGSHPGDGSDYGFWQCEDGMEDEW